MGDKYYQELKGKYKGTQGTYIYRVRKSRDELWGKPQKGGNCHKVVAKFYKGKKTEFNKYELLTPEEEELRNELFKKIVGKTLYKYESLISNIKNILNENVDLEEEIKRINLNGTIYSNYMNLLKKELKCDWLVVATIVEDINVKL